MWSNTVRNFANEITQTLDVKYMHSNMIIGTLSTTNTSGRLCTHCTHRHHQTQQIPKYRTQVHHALWWNQGFSYTRTHQIPAQVWSAQCLQCTGNPNLAVTISVISVILTSLLSNNVPHIINKIRVILYFIPNRDIVVLLTKIFILLFY